MIGVSSGPLTLGMSESPQMRKTKGVEIISLSDKGFFSDKECRGEK